MFFFMIFFRNDIRFFEIEYLIIIVSIFLLKFSIEDFIFIMKEYVFSIDYFDFV